VDFAELLDVMTNIAADVDEQGRVAAAVRLEQALRGEDVDPAGLVRHDAAHDVVEGGALDRVRGVVVKHVAGPALGVLEHAVGRVRGVAVPRVRQEERHVVEDGQRRVVEVVDPLAEHGLREGPAQHRRLEDADRRLLEDVVGGQVPEDADWFV
jgi:hypothetical protein